MDQTTHQTVINLDSVQFFSNFDSGNLSRAIRSGPNAYELWVSSDAANLQRNNYRIWFYFGVKNLRKDVPTRFTIMNLSNMRLYASPSYRVFIFNEKEGAEWSRIGVQGTFEQNFSNYYKYTWIYLTTQPNNTVYFSFALPYTVARCNRVLNYFQENLPPDTYFYRETIINSLDNREIELITISDSKNFILQKEQSLPHLFPNSNSRCNIGLRPIIFITARVHPGETPASFILENFLRVLLQDRLVGQTLRQNFVFKIIPMLNPDGVARGQFRLDQLGNNLNRFYTSPEFSLQPSIFAAKNYIQYLHETNNLFMYLDLHGQASKRGWFIFGNHLQGVMHTQNLLYAKLLSLNSQYLNYDDCDFNEKSMYQKDPNDSNTKEGCGRVAIYKMTQIAHCYTIEGCYACSQPQHPISRLINQINGITVPTSYFNLVSIPEVDNCYKNIYEDIGKSLAISILDLQDISPYSRLPASEFQNINGLMQWVRNNPLGVGLQRSLLDGKLVPIRSKSSIIGPRKKQVKDIRKTIQQPPQRSDTRKFREGLKPPFKKL